MMCSDLTCGTAKTRICRASKVEELNIDMEPGEIVDDILGKKLSNLSAFAP